MSQEGWAWSSSNSVVRLVKRKKHYFRYNKTICGNNQSKTGLLKPGNEVLTSIKCINCKRVLEREVIARKYEEA